MDRLGGIFGSQDGPDEEPDFPLGEDDLTDECPPPPIGQDERRMQVRAYNHWAALLGERNFPAIEELELDDHDDFGPYSVLLDFSAGLDEPKIRHLGSELAGECELDDDIDALDDVPSRSLLSRITDHYLQILANRAPIGFEAEFVNRRDNTTLYRGILLPCSSDDQTIDFVFGVINWKELADQQTADELLLEIGQALEVEQAAQGEDWAPAETPAPDGATAAEDDMPQPRGGRIELPEPEFGDAGDMPHSADDDAGFGDDLAGWDSKSIGETAKDYGLDEDYDEPELEDVDGVVDPLADESVGSGLSSLIGRSQRTRQQVDLSGGAQDFGQEGDDGDGYGDTAPLVPEAYDPLPEQAPEPESRPAIPEAFDPPAIEEPEELPAIEETAGPPPVEEAEEHTSSEESTELAANEEEVDDLYDALARARESADLARSSEDRSRGALYDAVGRAYDFSLEAQDNPQEFEELIAESGLKVQERAPMTPVVKLVFGVDYDKTRLTEYAAVLSHAHRLGIARGTLPSFLGEAEGGLKGVVKAERQARREEAGETHDQPAGVRDAIAEKLRALAPVPIEDLDRDGPEFALVMLRRRPDGTAEIVGEVPEDIPLIERSARKIIG